MVCPILFAMRLSFTKTTGDGKCSFEDPTLKTTLEQWDSRALGVRCTTYSASKILFLDYLSLQF